jgi:predicted ATP-grasp superfamily ATP-dependent carboligase
MRVFVYEYTCAAARAGEPLAPSLRAEGRAMLSAVLEDLNRMPGVETITLLGEEGSGCPGAVRRLGDAHGERPAFHELAGAAEGTLVIAPEFDGLLAERCRWVLRAGGRLLGPAPSAVELTADKLRLGEVLRRQGVPTPPCCRAAGAGPGQALAFPAVLKPRDGAGSQATCAVRARPDLSACLVRMRAEMPRAEFLLQPLARGLPASVAFLLGPGQEVALAPAEQHLTDDGRFRYAGGTVPLPHALARRATDLGRRAVRAVPGLRGYVGVDLILGEAPDGSADQVIEINPRLTTSYLGLRALARDNLAAAMLRVVRCEPVADLAWHAGPVRFRADGSFPLSEPRTQ